MVKHGFVAVNAEKVNIPSYLIMKDDIIQIKAEGTDLKRITENLKVNKDRGIPEWIKLDEAQLSAAIVRLPEREDIGFPIQE